MSPAPRPDLARPDLSGAPWAEVCAQGPEGYDAPPDDRYRVEAVSGDGAAAYGEIPPESAATLLTWLAPRPEDVLFDLGAGTGKLCLQALCATPLGAAVGVELSPFRHAAAEGRRSALLERLSPAGSAWVAPRLSFLREDFRAVDLARATLVYAGSTAYPDALLRGLAKNVAEGAPRLRLLITTRPLPADAARRFAERGKVRLPMSWSALEWLSVYEPRGTRERLP